MLERLHDRTDHRRVALKHGILSQVSDIQPALTVYLACVGQETPCKEMEKRGLAATVPSDQTDSVSGFDAP